MEVVSLPPHTAVDWTTKTVASTTIGRGDGARKPSKREDPHTARQNTVHLTTQAADSLKHMSRLFLEFSICYYDLLAVNHKQQK